MTKDKSRIQSCVDHINTAVDVDPWAKELVAEMGKEILKAQLSKKDATSDLQQTCNQLATDCISRQAVIDICNHVIDLWQGQLGEGALVAIKNAINNLPSVQPYTDKEIQKMQDMKQAEIEKAFELGQEDAKPIVKPERKKDIIQKFHDYQIDWLKSHYDIELEPQLEEMIVRFLHDTANCYMMEIDREEGEQE